MQEIVGLLLEPIALTHEVDRGHESEHAEADEVERRHRTGERFVDGIDPVVDQGRVHDRGDEGCEPPRCGAVVEREQGGENNRQVEDDDQSGLEKPAEQGGNDQADHEHRPKQQADEQGEPARRQMQSHEHHGGHDDDPGMGERHPEKA